MSCDYCFYCDEMEKRQQESYGFMSEQTLKNVIRRTMLSAEGAVVYAFQGGEPTVRGLEFFQKAIEFQQQYNKKGLQVSNVIQTNGYAVDEEWCRFFHDNHFLVGISVDGTKGLHDSLRHAKDGTGTYHKVLHATELMDQYHVDYNILTVVSKKIAENIKEIYVDFKRKGWKYQQYIACLDPLGKSRGGSPYALLPEQYGEFLITLFQMWYQDWEYQCQPYIRQFENWLAVLAGYQPESCDQRGICSIQNVVEADGSVYPCDFYAMDEYLLGNFNTDRFTQIQENAEKSGFIERSLIISDDCKKCEYYKICRGGCQRNRSYNVQAEAYENYFCKSYKMFFGACLEQLQTMVDSVMSDQ